MVMPRSWQTGRLMSSSFVKWQAVTQTTEVVKMAVTLLMGKALTWWRSVVNENWAKLGYVHGRISAML